MPGPDVDFKKIPTQFKHDVGGAAVAVSRIVDALNSKVAEMGGEQALGGLLEDKVSARRYGNVYLQHHDSKVLVVYGAIYARYAALGCETSWLGQPTSDELPLDDQGGRVSHFANGDIYWWPNTGEAIDMGDVRVRFEGLHCFAETDWDQMSDSDEPYALISVVTKDGTEAFSSKVDDNLDVDDGEDVPEQIDLYVGRPDAILLSTAVMEHDDGDANTYLGLVRDAGEVAGDYVKSQAGLAVGNDSGIAWGTVFEKAWRALVDAFYNALDLGDDQIGIVSNPLTTKQVVVMAAREQRHPFPQVGLLATLETDVIASQGASYKAYFTIERT